MRRAALALLLIVASNGCQDSDDSPAMAARFQALEQSATSDYGELLRGLEAVAADADACLRQHAGSSHATRVQQLRATASAWSERLGRERASFDDLARGGWPERAFAEATRERERIQSHLSAFPVSRQRALLNSRLRYLNEVSLGEEMARSARREATKVHPLSAADEVRLLTRHDRRSEQGVQREAQYAVGLVGRVLGWRRFTVVVRVQGSFSEADFAVTAAEVTLDQELSPGTSGEVPTTWRVEPGPHSPAGGRR